MKAKTIQGFSKTVSILCNVLNVCVCLGLIACTAFSIYFLVSRTGEIFSVNQAQAITEIAKTVFFGVLSISFLLYIIFNLSKNKFGTGKYKLLLLLTVNVSAFQIISAREWRSMLYVITQKITSNGIFFQFFEIVFSKEFFTIIVLFYLFLAIYINKTKIEN